MLLGMKMAVPLAPLLASLSSTSGSPASTKHPLVVSALGRTCARVSEREIPLRGGARRRRAVQLGPAAAAAPSAAEGHKTAEDVALRKNPDLYSEIDPGATAAPSSNLKLRNKPEVLAPAGGWDQARAAVENGADAIYFGMSDFNARARAANFDPGAEMMELMQYLHAHGVKGYVTLNILVFDKELEQVEKRIRQMAEAGVDAVIVQDLGVVQLIRKIAPSLPVHGSTQMSITSAEGVEFAAKLGVTRVVLGRELSIKEIDKVSTTVADLAEVEVFVHGALCVSYSGQCFSSEAWGGRSANRGQCAQACRMPYGLVLNGAVQELGDIKYLLSPQDLMAVEQVPGLIAAGVSCFKIEGRLKGPEYVAITTQVYRRAIDHAWAAMYGADSAPTVPRLQLSASERRDLQQVFSRGQDAHHDGLTPGFLEGVAHQRLVQGRSPRHRGVYLGEVTKVTSRGAVVELHAPIMRGDGVVFDSGHPENDEAGGSVYEVFDAKGRSLEAKEVAKAGRHELTFGRAAVDLRKVNVGDIVWRTSDPTLEARIRAASSSAGKAKSFMEHVNGVAVVAKGSLDTPLEMTFVDPLGHAALVVSGMNLSAASTVPMSEESLRKGLGEKLGGGPLSLISLDLSGLRLDDRLFLPASEVKAMRRSAVEQLMAAREANTRVVGLEQTSVLPALLQAPLATASRRAPSRASAPLPHQTADIHLTVLCRTRAQVEAALEVDWLSEVIVDFLEVQGLKEACEAVRAAGRKVVVATPRILKPDEQRLWQFYLYLNADSLLVRSAGLLHHFVQLGGPGAVVDLPGGKSAKIPKLRGDFSLNASNVLSTRHLLSLGLERLTPTHDLNAAQLGELASALAEEERSALECVIHQHLPIFHTEHCVFCRFLSDGNSYLDCGHPCEDNSVHLRDNHGEDHLVLADMGCRNTVFNAKAQSGAYYLRELASAGYRHFRIELVDEPANMLMDLLSEYALLADGERQPNQVWSFVSNMPDANGRSHGVTGGSLVTQVERSSDSLRPAGTAASDFES